MNNPRYVLILSALTVSMNDFTALGYLLFQFAPPEII